MFAVNAHKTFLALAFLLLAPAFAQAQGSIVVPTPRGAGESLDGSADGGLYDPGQLTSVIYTRIGDQLRGHILGMDGHRIQFNTPYLAGDARLTRSAVERIIFTKPEPEMAIDSVFVTNGDRIAGEVQELDEERLLIRTGAGVYLPIRRDAIRRISFGTGSALLLEADFSSGTIAPFREVEGDWSLGDGYLSAPYDPRQGGTNAIVTAEIPQEKAVTAVMTLRGTDRARNFDIVLFADGSENGRGQNCVLVTVYWNRLTVQSLRNRQHNTLGDSTFNVNNAAETSLRMTYDPQTGGIAIWIDGAKVGDYTIQEPITTGKYVSIVSRGPLAIKNFRILQGEVEDIGSDRKARKDKALVFTGAGSSGTQVQADKVTIADGKAHVEMQYGDVDYPLKDIAEILFPTDKLREMEPAGNAIVRTGASKLTVTLLSMGEDDLKCRSELYGDLTLKRASVREIVFHEMR